MAICEHIVPSRFHFRCRRVDPKEWERARPISYDEIRPGAYDPVARLGDMDIDGVWAQLRISPVSRASLDIDFLIHLI